MAYTLRLVAPPTIEPITLGEAKQHLRVDYAEDDTLIESLITVAREQCEDYTRTAMLTQTLDLVVEDPPCCVELPRPPLQSITNVYAVDDDGAETLVDPSTYRVDDISTPSRLLLKTGYSWPARTLRVRYTAGYTSPQSVPRGLRHAVAMLVALLYENRGEVRGQPRFVEELSMTIPVDVRMLLDPYVVYLW